MRSFKRLMLVGDRILVSPEDPAGMTKSGLYLPPTVQEREKIQSGYVVKTGPGYALPNPSFDDEPWVQDKEAVRYLPMQVEEGDFVIFLKSQGIEIEFEGETYIILPYSAILLIVRNEVHTS